MLEVPLNNLTALNDEIVRTWMPPATVRGTSDILYSCLVTIILCVYTAVHLNIPPPIEKPVWQYLRKAYWVFLGIFSAEIVVFSAFSQWVLARQLVRDLNNEHHQHAAQNSVHQPDPAANRDNPIAINVGENQGGGGDLLTSRSDPFDLEYGFYVIMGGVRVHVSKFTDSVDSMALSPYAVKWLAERNVFLKIPQSTIRDKSNADNLAKILVCIQILWMLTQCIARLVKGYPLTLLKIHTFVHVVCSSAMYVFWFKKPLNVSEATLITDLDETLLAHLVCESNFFTQFSTFRCHCYPKSGRRGLISIKTCDLYDAEVHMTQPPNQDPEQFVGSPAGHDCSHGKTWYISTSIGLNNSTLSLYNNDLQHRKISFTINISDTERRRHRLAGALAKASRLKEGSEWAGCALIHQAVNLAPGLDDIGVYGEYGLPGKWSQLALAQILQVAYAAVHAGAWNFFFPTIIESWLWRASTLILLGCSVPSYVTNAVMIATLPFLDDYVNDDNDGDDDGGGGGARKIMLFVKKMGQAVESISKSSGQERLLEIARIIPGTVLLCSLLILVKCCSLACIFARAYLVIESFISLRAVPIGVFAAIPWTSFVIHF